MTINRRLFIALGLFLLAPLGHAQDSVPEKRPLPILVPHDRFSQDCGQCHIAKRWDVIRPDFKFDHLKETGFPLNGAHSHIKCVECHNDRGPVQKYAARGCGGCHPDPHKNTLGTNCTQCHNEVNWRPNNMIAEHAKTAFPLTGRHLALECQQCHARAPVGDYRGEQILCYSCHQRDYQRAANHVTLNYPRTCGDCHTTVAWTGARFNHGFLSNLANCYACHQADFQRAAFHVAFNYPQTCGDCHNTNTFLGARFNHTFLGSNPVCYTCHVTDYQNAPSHVSKNYPKTCADCHTTTTWQTVSSAAPPQGVRR